MTKLSGQPVPPPLPEGQRAIVRKAGDYNFYVRRGYVQVIVNVRGTGRSGGFFNMFHPPAAQDVYEIIEWLAVQPWSDGNVGMWPETRFTPFYLHANGLLSEHEFWPNEGSTTFEDSHYNRGSLTFHSPPLVETTEVIGPMVLNLFASSTDTEVLWFIKKPVALLQQGY